MIFLCQNASLNHNHSFIHFISTVYSSKTFSYDMSDQTVQYYNYRQVIPQVEKGQNKTHL